MVNASSQGVYMTITLTFTPTVCHLDMDIIPMKYVSSEKQLISEAKDTAK